MRRPLLAMLAFSSLTAVAGTVQSLEQIPFADMNTSGDSLMLGDKKGLVFWADSSLKSPGAALHLTESKAWPSSWSGGIAERNSASPTKAIACSNANAAIYSDERTTSNPAGTWSNLSVSGPLLCAMTDQGDYAISSHDELIINQQTRIPLTAAPDRVLAVGSRFLLIYARGEAYWVDASSDKQTWTRSPAFSHGIGFMDNHTRMDANSSTVAVTDDFSTRMFAVEGDQLERPKSIPTSACDQGSVCGLSLAADGSWIVSGFWGHFYGEGNTLIGKLSIPISAARDKDGVAIAHSSRNGEFIYLGRDESDWGSLNQARRLSTAHTNSDLPRLSRAARPTDAWWRAALRVDEARALVAKAGVVPALVHVAMIDSGIDSLQPWLQDHRRLSQDIKDQLDSDQNGFVDDLWGYDFVDERAGAEDEFGHGTHVAGLLMASLNDETFGVAPNLRLTVYRALDRYGKSTSIDLARALTLAQTQDVDLIHCSWGGGADTLALRTAFSAKGFPLVISSAGNDGLNSDQYPEVPKIYPGVISVGAVDKKNRLAKFSNYGSESVDFLAPGEDIVSTVRGGGFGSMSGTSMAAPLVSGAYAWTLGILKARFPAEEGKTLQERSLKILCETASAVPGKARCGIIRLDKATARALEETI
ncbi:MAG: hypothetical protein EOP10_00070 [Proteobacteria bacterium]|nr:MAG: hypothetical protein EOP10_00070 [Pseudomonadota bacterium]